MVNEFILSVGFLYTSVVIVTDSGKTTYVIKPSWWRYCVGNAYNSKARSFYLNFMN